MSELESATLYSTGRSCTTWTTGAGLHHYLGVRGMQYIAAPPPRPRVHPEYHLLRSNDLSVQQSGHPGVIVIPYFTVQCGSYHAVLSSAGFHYSAVVITCQRRNPVYTKWYKKIALCQDSEGSRHSAVRPGW